MSGNAFSIYASHLNILARNQSRQNQLKFFICATILIAFGFAALIMAIRYDVLGATL